MNETVQAKRRVEDLFNKLGDEVEAFILENAPKTLSGWIPAKDIAFALGIKSFCSTAFDAKEYRRTWSGPMIDRLLHNRKTIVRSMPAGSTYWSYASANGPRSKVPPAVRSTKGSVYRGTVKAGKWQKSGNPGPVRACWDLYDQMVAENPCLTRQEFLKAAADHHIASGTAQVHWTTCTRNPGLRVSRTLTIEGRKK